MQFDAYYQLLARSDVKELALQTGRPPCVLIDSVYHPVAKHAATEDEILALLAETGSAEMLGLMEGPKKWSFDHPHLTKINVSAGYHGTVLQARLKRAPEAAERQTNDFNPSASIADLAVVAAKEAAAPSLGHDFGPPPARRKPLHEAPARAQPAPPVRRPTAADHEPRPAAVVAPEPVVDDMRIDPSRNAVIETSTPNTRPKPARKVALDDLFDQPGAFSQDDDDLPVPSDVNIAPVDRRHELDVYLRAARERDASDLHILADRAPTLRIAGDLVPAGDALPAAFVAQMLLPIVPDRVRGDLDDHGACDFALQTEMYGRFRVNITRQRTGYKMTARPIRARVPTLTELGLPEAIASATNHHQGLIVVTGPTGHGKTTTLAAIVDIINSHKAHHVITVEDPIEFVHPRKLSVMSQREVGTHTKKFATALKGSLREDPDVIVVGELRDTETVRMALSASETGHLVISTMNTPSAAKAIERLIDLFPPGDQPQVRLTLAGGLRLIISQRLVPNSDHTGMVAAAELLPGSPPLWALIRDGKTFQIPSLQQRGKALGIVRLDDSLAELVRTGQTTLENARAFAENPGDFEAVVSGKNVRGGEELTIDSFDPTQAAAQAAKDKAKDVFQRAGKFFGNDKK